MVDEDNNTFIEEHIHRAIEGTQKLLNPQFGKVTPEEQEAAIISISVAAEKYFGFKIKTLQNAPRDPVKLKDILRVK